MTIGKKGPEMTLLPTKNVYTLTNIVLIYGTVLSYVSKHQIWNVSTDSFGTSIAHIHFNYDVLECEFAYYEGF